MWQILDFKARIVELVMWHPHTNLKLVAFSLLPELLFLGQKVT